MGEREPAELRIFEQRGVIAWRWHFRDQRGSFDTSVELDVDAPHVQALLERASPPAPAPPGTELRAELIRCLRAVLGERGADAIATSPAAWLRVRGTRASNIALSLPYELLFRPEKPGRVVRLVAPNGSQQLAPPAPPSDERLFTAFALHADDPFLPLHAEASILAATASEAGIAYDELFLGFAGEDVLGAGEGASIVHLAGHGEGGRWRCHRRHGETASLTSRELIAAWREAPPRLFVLDFCESSSEDGLLRLAEATMGGILALQEYSLQTLSLEQAAPSASMALDLTSAFPTAALALRTSADDTQAREFAAAFYRAHLVDGLRLEEAFAKAVAERGFYDDAGLPVPCLYVSAAQPDSHRRRPPGPVGQPAVARALNDAQRRCLNGYYKAIGPLGLAMDRRRVCSITGDVDGSRAVLINALEAMAELWDAIGETGVSLQADFKEIGPDHHLVKWLPTADGITGCVGIDLEGLPDGTVIGELLAHRRGVSLEDLLLLATATRNVPATVQAVLEIDVADLAHRLREIAKGRSPVTDRGLAWQLASELIDRLPPRPRGGIRAWTNSKWEKLVSLGPLAIDVYASRFLLGEDAWLFDKSSPALDRMLVRKELEVDDLKTVVDQMLDLGIAHNGMSLLARDCPPMLVMDQLTAARAWAACSEDAAAAYVEDLIERKIREWGLDHSFAAARTEQLASLAGLSLSAGDSQAPRLIAELSSRGDGAELAAALRAQAEPELRREIDELTAADAPDNWVEWRKLQEAGLTSDAEAMLETLSADPVASDHPLRISIYRLGIASLPPEETAAHAAELEGQLRAPADERQLTGTELDLLYVLGQVRWRAMRQLGQDTAAADLLHDHFRSVHVQEAFSHLVIYGGAAVMALTRAGKVSEARNVWGLIAPRARAMRPSVDKIMALSAEIELLAREGRALRAREAATAMIDELATWEGPRAAAVRTALSSSAIGFVDRPERSVLYSLLQLCAGEEEENSGGEFDRIFALELGDSTLNEVLVAATELAERIPLECLGVTREEYLAAVSAYFERLAELDPITAGEALLGAATITGLSARAADGCRMSQLILASACDEEARDAPSPAADAAELQRLAREHTPLAELLADVLLDNHQQSAPVIDRAFHGDREARVVWAGLLLGDIQQNPRPAAVTSLLSLSRGEAVTAQSELEPTPSNVDVLCSACVLIERCLLGEGGLDDADISSEVIALAQNGWRVALSFASASRRPAGGLLRALANGIAPPAELMAVLARTADDDVPLREACEVAEDEALTTEILNFLDAHPDTQLALASVAVDDGEAKEDALRVLKRHAASTNVVRALRALERLLWLELKKPEELQDHEAMASDLARLRFLFEQADLTALERGRHLATISTVGFVTQQIELARESVRAALALPADAMSQTKRYGFHFNHVQASRTLEDEAAGARALAEAGAELGFDVACMMFLRARIDPHNESSLPFAEAFASLDPGPDTDPNAASPSDVRLEFSSLVEGAPGWEAVAKAVRVGTEAG